MLATAKSPRVLRLSAAVRKRTAVFRGCESAGDLYHSRHAHSPQVQTLDWITQVLAGKGLGRLNTNNLLLGGEYEEFRDSRNGSFVPIGHAA
jgi:hypothetical protein